MTTSQTPLRILTKQAETIAMLMKTAARGDLPNVEQYAKLREAWTSRTAPKFAIAMDDKLITLEMSWLQIESTSEAALTAYILKFMRDERSKPH